MQESKKQAGGIRFGRLIVGVVVLALVLVAGVYIYREWIRYDDKNRNTTRDGELISELRAKIDELMGSNQSNSINGVQQDLAPGLEMDKTEQRVYVEQIFSLVSIAQTSIRHGDYVAANKLLGLAKQQATQLQAVVGTNDLKQRALNLRHLLGSGQTRLEEIEGQIREVSKNLAILEELAVVMPLRGVVVEIATNKSGMGRETGVKKSNESRWHLWWQQFVNSVRSVVTIKKKSVLESETGISPDVYRLQLRLCLQRMNMGLLLNDGAKFENGLVQALELVQGRFERRSESVEMALGMLQRMSEFKFEQDLAGLDEVMLMLSSLQ